MFIHLIILAKITGSEVDLMTLARDVVFSAVVPVLFGEGILPQTHQEFKHFQKQFDQFDSNFEHGAKLPDFLLKEWAKSKYFLLDVFGKALQKKAYANVEDTLLQAMVESLEGDCATNYATLLLWASLANAVPITFWTLAFVLSDQGIKKDLQQEVDLVLGPYIDSGKYTRLLLSLPEVLQYLSEFLTLSLLYLISNWRAQSKNDPLIFWPFLKVSTCQNSTTSEHFQKWPKNQGIVLALSPPILLTICHTVLILLVQRIWYWIN